MTVKSAKPPPVRACLFDMDGLLLNTEDLYTAVANRILRSYGRPDYPWTEKCKIQARPSKEAIAVFMQWAQLPITNEEYAAQQLKGQEGIFSSAQLLPGVAELLQTLDRLQIPIALATSSDQRRFTLKTTHLQKEFSVFKPEHRVVGDDKRITPGRGKPCPDIYLLALKTLNDARLARGDTDLIKPEECLVFEDAVLGVEAGRRAGMQVVWCPHPKLYEIYASRTKEVLAGGTNDHQRTGDIGDVPQGQIDDGYARYMSSLADFPYADYGIRT